MVEILVQHVRISLLLNGYQSVLRVTMGAKKKSVNEKMFQIKGLRNQL